MSSVERPKQIVYSDEIDLLELAQSLWHEKLTIFVIFAVFLLGSAAYAFSLPDILRSEAVLIPAESNASSNPVSRQFSQFASITGVPVSAPGSNQITRALALLESRDFAIQFIRTHGLAESFSQYIEDLDVTQVSDASLYNLFSGLLSVAYDPETELITLGIEWYDPEAARDWLSFMIQDINDLIKSQDLSEATNSIAYLEEQLEMTPLVEMQRVFYQLIESQTRVVMLADVRNDYVFRVIDSPYVPEQSIRPRKLLILLFGALIGFSIGFLAALVKLLGRRTSPSAEN